MNALQLVELRRRIGAQSRSAAPDAQTKRLFLYLFAGTRGGASRMRIVMLLLGRPYNTHQLAQAMDLDYKAVQHHMRVLEKNSLVSRVGKRYGAVFRISNFLEYNIGALDEAARLCEKRLDCKKTYL